MEMDRKELMKWLPFFLTLILILMALRAGQLIGYRQGYTYVKDHYEAKIKYCFCPDTSNKFLLPSEVNNSSLFSDLVKITPK